MDGSAHGKDTGSAGGYSSRIGRLQKKAKDKVSGKIERLQSRVKRLSDGMLSMSGSSPYGTSYMQQQADRQQTGGSVNGMGRTNAR
jgi:hypothetical protein